MLYVILLLILAVLLFGSSAVIGAAGMVLGFIAAAVALIWASIAFHVEPFVVLVIGVAGFFSLLGLMMLVGKLIEPWDRKRIEAITAKSSKEMEAKLAKMTPAERQRFVDEKMAAIRK